MRTLQLLLFTHLLFHYGTNADDLAPFDVMSKATVSVYPEIKDDKNFSCTAGNKAYVIAMDEYKVCDVTMDCKYLPSDNNPETARVYRNDYVFAFNCVANTPNSCPSVKQCMENSKKEKHIGTTFARITKQVALDGEVSKKFGHCRYTSGKNVGAGIFAMPSNGDGITLVCATPVKCENGVEIPPGPLAICDPTDAEEVKLANGEVTYYPICPGPATCLENPAEYKMVNVDSGESTKQTKSTPHARSTDKTTKSNRSEATPASGSGGAGKKTH